MQVKGTDASSNNSTSKVTPLQPKVTQAEKKTPAKQNNKTVAPVVKEEDTTVRRDYNARDGEVKQGELRSELNFQSKKAVKNINTMQKDITSFMNRLANAGRVVTSDDGTTQKELFKKGETGYRDAAQLEKIERQIRLNSDSWKEDGSISRKANNDAIWKALYGSDSGYTGDNGFSMYADYGDRPTITFWGKNLDGKKTLLGLDMNNMNDDEFCMMQNMFYDNYMDTFSREGDVNNNAERKANGLLPKTVEDMYNFSDEGDVWLYMHGLPPSQMFNEYYIKTNQKINGYNAKANEVAEQNKLLKEFYDDVFGQLVNVWINDSDKEPAEGEARRQRILNDDTEHKYTLDGVEGYYTGKQIYCNVFFNTLLGNEKYAGIRSLLQKSEEYPVVTEDEGYDPEKWPSYQAYQEDRVAKSVKEDSSTLSAEQAFFKSGAADLYHLQDGYEDASKSDANGYYAFEDGYALANEDAPAFSYDSFMNEANDFIKKFELEKCLNEYYYNNEERLISHYTGNGASNKYKEEETNYGITTDTARDVVETDKKNGASLDDCIEKITTMVQYPDTYLPDDVDAYYNEILIAYDIRTGSKEKQKLDDAVREAKNKYNKEDGIFAVSRKHASEDQLADEAIKYLDKYLQEHKVSGITTGNVDDAVYEFHDFITNNGYKKRVDNQTGDEYYSTEAISDGIEHLKEKKLWTDEVINTIANGYKVSQADSVNYQQIISDANEVMNGEKAKLAIPAITKVLKEKLQLDDYEIHQALRRQGYERYLDKDEEFEAYWKQTNVDAILNDVEYRHVSKDKVVEFVNEQWDATPYQERIAQRDDFVENIAFNTQLNKTIDDQVVAGILGIGARVGSNIASGLISFADLIANGSNKEARRWDVTEAVATFAAKANALGYAENQSIASAGIKLGRDVVDEVARMYVLAGAGRLIQMPVNGALTKIANAAGSNLSTITGLADGVGFVANESAVALGETKIVQMGIKILDNTVLSPFVWNAIGSEYTEAMGMLAPQINAARERGEDLTKYQELAKTYAIITGTAEGVLETFETDQWLGMAMGEGRLASAMMNSTPSKLGARAITRKARLIAMTSSVLGEAFEEGVGYGLGAILQTSMMNMGSLKDVWDWNEFGYNVLLGGLTGGVGAAFSLGSHNAANIAYNYMIENGYSMDTFDLATAALFESYMTDEQKQKVNKKLMSVKEFNEAINSIDGQNTRLKQSESNLEFERNSRTERLAALEQEITALQEQGRNAKTNKETADVFMKLSTLMEEKASIEQDPTNEYNARITTAEEAVENCRAQVQAAVTNSQTSIKGHMLAMYNLFGNYYAAMDSINNVSFGRGFQVSKIVDGKMTVDTVNNYTDYFYNYLTNPLYNFNTYSKAMNVFGNVEYANTESYAVEENSAQRADDAVRYSEYATVMSADEILSDVNAQMDKERSQAQQQATDSKVKSTRSAFDAQMNDAYAEGIKMPDGSIRLYTADKGVGKGALVATKARDNIINAIVEEQAFAMENRDQIQYKNLSDLLALVKSNGKGFSEKQRNNIISANMMFIESMLGTFDSQVEYANTELESVKAKMEEIRSGKFAANAEELRAQEIAKLHDVEAREGLPQTKPSEVPHYSDLTITERNELKTTAKQLGLRVVITDIPDIKGRHVDGYYKNGTVYINSAQETSTGAAAKMALLTLKHEATHSIETHEGYSAYSDYIINTIAPQFFNDRGGETYVKQSMEKFRSQIIEICEAEGTTFTEDMVDREFVAVFTSEFLFTDKRAINRLVRDQQSIAGRILSWIDTKLEKLGIGTQTTNGTKEFRNQLLKAQTMYRKAFRSAGVDVQTITTQNAVPKSTVQTQAKVEPDMQILSAEQITQQAQEVRDANAQIESAPVENVQRASYSVSGFRLGSQIGSTYAQMAAEREARVTGQKVPAIESAFKRAAKVQELGGTEPQTAQSKVVTNTLNNILNDTIKESANIGESDGEYDVKHNADTLNSAADTVRLNIEESGVEAYADRLASERPEATPEAVAERFDMIGVLARQGDFKRLKQVSESLYGDDGILTNAGQTIQVVAAFKQTPGGLVADAVKSCEQAEKKVVGGDDPNYRKAKKMSQTMSDINMIIANETNTIEEKVKAIRKASNGIAAKMMQEALTQYENGEIDDAVLADYVRNAGRASIGLPTFTQADMQELVGYLDARDAATDDYTKKVYTEKAARIIANASYTQNLSDKSKAIRRFLMLFNPKTGMKNFWSNVPMGIVENIKDVPGTFIDMLVSIGTGERTTNAFSLGKYTGQVKGFGRGAFEAGKDIANFAKDPTGSVQTSAYPGRYEMGELASKADVFKSDAMNSLNNVVGLWMQLGDRAFAEAAYDSRIAELASLGRDINDPKLSDEQREAIKTEALNYSLDRVFQSNSALAQAAGNIRKSLGAFGDIMIPFVQTPANIFDKLIDYSPAGLARGLAQIGMAGAKGQIGEGKSGFNQKLFVDRIGRGLTGTAIMGLGMILASKGLLTKGSEDRDERELVKQAGAKEYALKLGDDNYATIEWAEPTGSSLLIGAALYELFNKTSIEGGDVLDVADALRLAGIAGGDVFFSNSFMSNLSNMFTYNDSISDAIVDTMLSGTSQYTSSFAAAFARCFDDYERDTYDPNEIKQEINYLISRVPGLRETLPVKIGTDGQLVENQSGDTVFERIIQSMLIPGYTSKETDDPLNKELYRLYVAGYTDQILPVVGKNVNGVTLTTEQRESYQQHVGSNLGELILKEISLSRYKNATDEERAQMIGDIISDNKSKIQRQWQIDNGLREK